MVNISESDLESMAIAWLESLGWQIKNGAEIAPDGATPERSDFSQVVLEGKAGIKTPRSNIKHGTGKGSTYLPIKESGEHYKN